jgi:hypothetical protein
MGALRIKDFCREYGIGSTRLWEVINSGALDVRRVGRRVLITRASAEAWLLSLPTPQPRSRSARHGGEIQQTIAA